MQFTRTPAGPNSRANVRVRPLIAALAVIFTVCFGGLWWRLGAGPGERVAPGDVLAQTVDCGAAYLAVDVPQDRVEIMRQATELDPVSPIVATMLARRHAA